ncbi:hypothetical protein PV326_004551 [Microctonus aethiopoides]|nr:hypothetical protein PV326_004551 [Microctonus aethiopoides]
MKTIFYFLAISVVICLTEAGLNRDRHQNPPYINRPPPPSTPRFRRSPQPEPQGSIVFQGTKPLSTKPLSGPERRPSYSLDYQHNIYEGKNGHISAGGGALKLPGQHVQPHIGIQGTWRFRRDTDQLLNENLVDEQ